MYSNRLSHRLFCSCTRNCHAHYLRCGTNNLYRILLVQSPRVWAWPIEPETSYFLLSGMIDAI